MKLLKLRDVLQTHQLLLKNYLKKNHIIAYGYRKNPMKAKLIQKSKEKLSDDV